MIATGAQGFSIAPADLAAFRPKSIDPNSSDASVSFHHRLSTSSCYACHVPSMCGLLFSLRLVASTLPTDDPDFAALLAAVTPRGPDSLKVHVSHIALPDGQTVELKLAASVLGLRGQGVTVQPVEDDSAVFGWNGQVFQGMDIGLDENDTSKLFERLRHEQTEDVLASIEGP